MKIRGSVLGTNIKPEKVLVKATDLTEEQKAQARANIGAVENPATEHYYANLSSAISDINAGTDSLEVAPASAAVKVLRCDSGKITVKLVEDVSESVQIDISADVDIDLNGHTLYLTTAGAYLNFTEGTNCTINGEVAGSEIRKNGTSTSTDMIYFINADGNSLRLCGGSYYVNGTYYYVIYGIYPSSKCTNFEMDGIDLSIDVVTSTVVYAIVAQGSKQHIRNSSVSVNATVGSNPIDTVQAYGYYQTYGNDCSVTNSEVSVVVGGEYLTTTSKLKAYGLAFNKVPNATVKDCVIIADAPGDDSTTHNAIGIVQSGSGVLTCVDTDVTGTHSAAQCEGDLYVTGGTFNGYSHGGFYLHGDGTSAYINNARMIFGEYTGVFTDVSFGAGAGFYIGDPKFSKNGISVYMDGCTISGTGNEPFVVRPAKEGSTNYLYISNTQNNSSASVIRLNGEANQEYGDGAKMEIGIGCNFTADDTTHPEDAKETAMLYRYVKEDTLLDGRDFDALMKGVVSMTDINEKLDAILTSATFSVARGSFTPSATGRTVIVEGVPANAKNVVVSVAGSFPELESGVRPITYVTFTAFPEKGATSNYTNMWIEYLSGGTTKGAIGNNASVVGNSLNIDTGNDVLLFIGGTAYEWTAYCWNE